MLMNIRGYGNSQENQLHCCFGSCKTSIRVNFCWNLCAL